MITGLFHSWGSSFGVKDLSVVGRCCLSQASQLGNLSVDFAQEVTLTNVVARFPSKFTSCITEGAASAVARTLQLCFLEHAVQAAVSFKTADLCRQALERLCRGVLALRSEFVEDVVRQIEDVLLMVQPAKVTLETDELEKVVERSMKLQELVGIFGKFPTIGKVVIKDAVETCSSCATGRAWMAQVIAASESLEKMPTEYVILESAMKIYYEGGTEVLRTLLKEAKPAEELRFHEICSEVVNSSIRCYLETWLDYMVKASKSEVSEGCVGFSDQLDNFHKLLSKSFGASDVERGSPSYPCLQAVPTMNACAKFWSLMDDMAKSGGVGCAPLHDVQAFAALCEKVAKLGEVFHNDLPEALAEKLKAVVTWMMDFVSPCLTEHLTSLIKVRVAYKSDFASKRNGFLPFDKLWPTKF